MSLTHHSEVGLSLIIAGLQEFVDTYRESQAGAPITPQHFHFFFMVPRLGMLHAEKTHPEILPYISKDKISTANHGKLGQRLLCQVPKLQVKIQKFSTDTPTTNYYDDIIITIIAQVAYTTSLSCHAMIRS